MIGSETERGISRAGAIENQAGSLRSQEGAKESCGLSYFTAQKSEETEGVPRLTGNSPGMKGLFPRTKRKEEHYETNAACRLCSHLAQSRDLDLSCNAESKSRGAECRASATCSRP